MTKTKKIAKVKIKGLHGTFDYTLSFPRNEDTVILIAPNGHGKTALLSLLNDCLSLNFGKASHQVFDSLEVAFTDKSRWRFVRKFEEETPSAIARVGARKHLRWAEETRRHVRNPYWIDMIRYDKDGELIEEELPEIPPSYRRTILRNIERFEPWILHNNEPVTLDSLSRETYSHEAFQRYFELVSHDDSVRSIVSKTFPTFVWPTASKMECLFIETQRILYEEKSRESDREGPTHKEEILRQADRLTQALREKYTEYAATSQALDRTFPSRLIQGALTEKNIDEKALRDELSAIEEKRSNLTDVGILVEQADQILNPEQTISPRIFDALQIYVEDSNKKLSTFDDIYPKLSVFTELVSKKLHPKKLQVSREDGAALKKGDQSLSLSSLSSGEKHEFIMLYKLIFDASPGSLVLIDEPEISLHVVWQLQFMSDLQRIQNANPFQCIIATHSPQIFQGHKNLLIDLADQA